MELRLLSWNVHAWVGADLERRPERALDVVRELNPQVVALQEVEGTDWRDLARDAGYSTISGPTVGESFGNALLTRLPVLDVRQVDLSVPTREPRGAIDVTLATGSEPIRVVATHFGLRAGERREQAERLARHVRHANEEACTILLGDLNDWTPGGRQVAPLARAIGPLSRLRTFPSRRPLFALDRATCRSSAFATRIEVLASANVRPISDHLPLCVSLHRIEAADRAEPRGAARWRATARDLLSRAQRQPNRGDLREDARLVAVPRGDGRLR